MLRNKRLVVSVQLLAMCRVEISKVIARIIPKYLQSQWKWQKELKQIAFPLPLLSFESSMFVKKKKNRQKKSFGKSLEKRDNEMKNIQKIFFKRKTRSGRLAKLKQDHIFRYYLRLVIVIFDNNFAWHFSSVINQCQRQSQEPFHI